MDQHQLEGARNVEEARNPGRRPFRPALPTAAINAARQRHGHARASPQHVVRRRSASSPTTAQRRAVYVVERRNHVNPVAFLAGAVIGAAIVHHAVTGY
jgi:hypothetical protein